LGTQLAKSGTLKEREEKRQQLEDQLEKVNEQVGQLLSPTLLVASAITDLQLTELVSKRSESFFTSLQSFVEMAKCVDDAKQVTISAL
jgi:hypothetical protein